MNGCSMFDDEISMIRDTAERIFTDYCGREVLAAAAAGKWPADLWAQVEASGLAMALVSENGGGAALPVFAALSLIEVAAEYAAPIPLGETMIAAWLLDRAGLPVPSGPLTFAAVIGNAEAAGSSWRLTGVSQRVPWGSRAGVVAVADGEAGPRIFLLDPHAMTVELGTNLAGEPRDTLTIDALVGTGAPSPVSVDQLRVIGAAIRTMQIAGALRSATTMALQYARDRVQFGRSLSKFQAIQQSLAVLATQTAVSSMAATMARTALANDDLLPNVAMAKARAGEAASVGAAIAHQVHGAIGFTLEYDLQVFTKRLYAWRDEFGNEAEWNLLYGNRIAALGADGLWSAITAAA
jgi:acyl-CoA dehydrogenase